MSHLLLASITFIAYTAATYWQGRYLHRYGNVVGNKRHTWLFHALCALAVLSHAWLLHEVIDIGHGQNLSFFNVLSQVCWLMVLVLWIVMIRKPVESLVLFAFPVAAASVVVMLLFPGHNIVLAAESYAQLGHILLSMLTYSVVCLAALQSVLVMGQEALLRRHQSLALVRILPPLQTMERILFQMIALGFGLLSLLLLSSVYFFTGALTGSLWLKIGLSFLTWGLFALLLCGRYLWGWRGPLAIRYTLGSVVLLSLVAGSMAWRL